MSVAFLADENFNRLIVRGVLRRLPEAQILRVQDAGLRGWKDPALLEWAAKNSRVFLTHDERTVIAYANQRLAAGLPMSGVFEIKRSFPIGRAIEEIMIVSECSSTGEWAGRVQYLPL